MKHINKILMGMGVFVLVFTFIITIVPTKIFAASAVNLGSLTNFAVFSNTAISNTGTSAITGDIGTGPGVTSTAITGFSLSAPPTTFTTSSLVSGNIYAYDYNTPTPTKEQNASSDLTTAYNNALVPATTVLDAGACVSGTCDLGGLNLAPGVYTFDGSGNVNITTNLTLTGNSSAVWIFQIPGNLNISSAKSIVLSGGAIPANIFWAVAGTSTLQTTSAFEGNILAGPGASTIAMQNGATLQGRAFGQTDVSLISNMIVNPSVSLVTAIGTATTMQGTSVITYTLTTGVFNATTGVVNSNWTLGGTDVADLGTISSVVLSAGNTVATVTVSGTVVGAHNYTILPTQATFSAGFTAPIATAVTVTSATTVSMLAISGVTAPVTGATPVTTLSDTGQYTGTIAWSGSPTSFVSATVYTATITLTADSGYTFSGVAANQFTVSGATATNPLNSGVVTALFPATSTTIISGGGGGGSLITNIPTPTPNPTTSTSTTSTTPSLPNTGIYNPITNTLPVVILGCDNRVIGFSTTTGQSCVGNTINIILGCSGTTGFSTVTGQVCSNDSTAPALPMAGIAPTYDFGIASLVKGSTGAAVMELQRFLNANLNLNLVVDGYLGPKTIAVVKQWQTNNGLVADGIVGVNTKLKMNAVVQ